MICVISPLSLSLKITTHIYIYIYILERNVTVTYDLSPVLLEPGDPSVKVVDKVLNNVFRWAWLDEKIPYTDVNKDPQTEVVGNILSKCKKSGAVWCKICYVEIMYSTSVKQCKAC